MRPVPWGRVIALAIIGACVTVGALLSDAYSSGRGVAELIDPGADSLVAPLLRADLPGIELPTGTGHDGQSYYAIARSPMHLDEVTPYLDRPRYRAGRPLLPWLAWLIHPGGGGEGLVIALASVNAAALLLGGVATGVLAATLGAGQRAAGYLALAFPIAPGCLASFGLTTPDALATALALAALALAWRRRPWWAACAGVLAVLSKESLLLVLLGHAIVRRRRADWMPAAAALAAVGVWAVVVRHLIPISTESFEELKPFVHLPRLIRGWLDGDDALAAVMVIGTAVVGVVALVRRGLRAPLGGVIVLQLALLPMLHFNVLQLNWNASRTMLPLMIASAIALATPRDAPVPSRSPAPETPPGPPRLTTEVSEQRG